MNALLWWTGAIVWAVIAFAVFWAVGVELLVIGLANSISWHRWRLTDRLPEFRWRNHWWRIALSVIRGAGEFWGYRNKGNSRWSDKRGGYWNGLGDWRAPPTP